MLSTYLSLGRHQLSFSDASYAIYFTALSPMGIYFFFSNARDLWRNWRRIFTRPHFSRLPRRVLVFFLPILMFTLLFVSSLPNALTDSHCLDRDTPTEFNFTRMEKFAIIPGVFAPFGFGLFFILYTLRHSKDVFVRARKRTDSSTQATSRTCLRRCKFVIRFPFSWLISLWYVGCFIKKGELF